MSVRSDPHSLSLPPSPKPLILKPETNLIYGTADPPVGVDRH